MAHHISRVGDPELTPRELDVLLLIARGYDIKQVAAELNIANSTAACHRMRIMGKLNVHSVAGLTGYAIQKGIIDVGEQSIRREMFHVAYQP
jgi:DNA-binding NarL/FixJ family response regulator